MKQCNRNETKTNSRVFMSKCKPGASDKDFWNAIGPFMSKKNKTQPNTILKEGDSGITNTPELYEIFANFLVQ